MNEQIKWTLVEERKLLPPWIPEAKDEPNSQYFKSAPHDDLIDPMQNVDPQTEFYAKSIRLQSTKSKSTNNLFASSNVDDDNNTTITSSLQTSGKFYQEKGPSMKRNYTSDSLRDFMKSEESRKIEQKSKKSDSLKSIKASDAILEVTTNLNKTILKYIYRKSSKVVPTSNNVESLKRAKSFSGSTSQNNNEIARCRRRKSCDGDICSLNDNINPLGNFEREHDETGSRKRSDRFLRQRSLSRSSSSIDDDDNIAYTDRHIVHNESFSKRRNSSSRSGSSKNRRARRPSSSSRDLNVDQIMERKQRSNSTSRKSISSSANKISQEQESNSRDNSNGDPTLKEVIVASPYKKLEYRKYKHFSRYGVFYF